MEEEEKEARFDLEERTFQFALSMRQCIASCEWSRAQWRDIDQILRSSGSVAANYVEADNAVSKPDFFYRIRVAKKECVETRLWLRLLGATTHDAPSRNLSGYSIANPTNSSAYSRPSFAKLHSGLFH